LQKAAEAFLPALESKEGIVISMDDIDGLHVWSFKYRSAIYMVGLSGWCKNKLKIEYIVTVF